MNKEQLIKKIALEFSVDEIEVSRYFDSIFHTISLAFKKNRNVNISEFGKFILRTKLSEDGEKTKAISFIPAKYFAIDVNYNFSNLIPVKIRTLDEKSLKEEIREPSDIEEVLLIESEFDVIEKEISSIDNFLTSSYEKNLRKELLIDNREDEVFEGEIPEDLNIISEDDTMDPLKAEQLKIRLSEALEKEKIGREKPIAEEITEEEIQQDLTAEVIEGDMNIESDTPLESMGGSIEHLEKLLEEISEYEPEISEEEEAVEENVEDGEIVQEENAEKESNPNEIRRNEFENLEDLPDGIASGDKDEKSSEKKISSEESEQSNDIIKDEIASEENAEEEYSSFTKVDDLSLKDQTVFKDSDMFIIDTEKIKEFEEKSLQDESKPQETEPDSKKIDIKPIEKKTDIKADIPGKNIELEDSYVKPENDNIRELKDELQRMLFEREKILNEIKKLEDDPNIVSDIEGLINKFSGEPDDLLDIKLKNTDSNEVPDKKDKIPEHGETFEEHINKLADSTPYLFSSDKGKLSIDEKSVGSIDAFEKDFDNPEMKIFGKLMDEPRSGGEEEEINFNNLVTYKEQYKDISKSHKSIDTITPAKLSDAFTDIESSSLNQNKDNDRGLEEHKIKDYNDVFKPVDKYVLPKVSKELEQPAILIEKPHQKKNMKKVFISIIIFIIIIIVFFVFFEIFSKKTEPTNKKDNISSYSESKGTKNSNEAPVNTEQKYSGEEKIIYQENDIYFKQNARGVFIQIGTYATEKEANIKTFLLKSQNLNVEVEDVNLGKNEHVFRVKVGPYKDLEDAKTAFESIKK
jgi:nucleoid DNA-binding protein